MGWSAHAAVLQLAGPAEYRSAGSQVGEGTGFARAGAVVALGYDQNANAPVCRTAHVRMASLVRLGDVRAHWTQGIPGIALLPQGYRPPAQGLTLPSNGQSQAGFAHL